MIPTSLSPIYSRPFAGDDDFWRVRNLLIETYSITPLAFNWDVRRWDGQRFYAAETSQPTRLLGRVQLWETADGRLVGAVNPEGNGNAHLQLHPDFRQLESEMVAWAEAHLAEPSSDGPQRQLEIFVNDDDPLRQQLLAARGYRKTTDRGVTRRVRLDQHRLEEPQLAPGYTLRTTQPKDLRDCQQIANLLNAAFNRTFHNALEYQNFTRLAPSFRRDLDLVAVASDGTFAAYVGVPYDEVNHYGIFEPVCTHPEHRRHGLARTLMLEGLQRLRALDAITVSVGTGDMIPANRLYDSIGFSEVEKGCNWQKLF